MTVNLHGIAHDAFWMAVPDDIYEPCPCGCGKKFRFVAKDEKVLAQHEKKFIDDWLKNHEEKKPE